VVDRRHPSLSIKRQCRLLDISRSGLYYQPKGISEEGFTFMKLVDRQYMVPSFYGAHKIAAWLKTQGHLVNRKCVRRLMRLMGLKAIYRRPRTSKPAPDHKIYPYLLGVIKMTRPNQVWAADITCIPMAKGEFLYLVAIIDWYSRYVLSWRLSNRIPWTPVSVLRLWRRHLRRTDLNRLNTLRKQEEVVFNLMAGALTNKDIADTLFITDNTVKIHVRNIMHKLHARHRLEATVCAIEEGLQYSVDGSGPESM